MSVVQLTVLLLDMSGLQEPLMLRDVSGVQGSVVH